MVWAGGRSWTCWARRGERFCTGASGSVGGAGIGLRWKVRVGTIRVERRA